MRRARTGPARRVRKAPLDRDVDVGQSDQSRRARLVAARGKSKGAVSMPKQRIDPSLEMYYELDNFTDPWHEPETILLLHGNAESSAMWYAWVPALARRFRVVRPDMRGFGASTPMPRDYAWSLDGVVNDFAKLMDSLGIPRFHLVGAKIAGTISRRFAARFPQRVQTLTLVGVPGPRREHKPGVLDSWLKLMEEK